MFYNVMSYYIISYYVIVKYRVYRRSSTGSAAMHSSAVLPWLRRNGVNTNES